MMTTPDKSLGRLTAMPAKDPHNIWHAHLLCMSTALLLATVSLACHTAILFPTAHHQHLLLMAMSVRGRHGLIADAHLLAVCCCWARVRKKTRRVLPLHLGNISSASFYRTAIAW